MTEISKVPAIRFNGFVDAWEQRKLDDISEKVTEKNKNREFTETLTNSAEYGIISQSDFFDKDISNINNIDGYYIVRPDDFVYNPRISNFAPVGPIKRNNLNKIGIMSPLYYVFRTRNIAPSFLEKYFDSTYWHKFMKLNGDSGARADRFAIKDSTFKEMPIPYPRVEEQAKIGNFFKQMDDTIALHQSKLLKLKNIKKAMLEKMFPKNGSTIPEIRFAGFTEPWEQHRFGELAQIRRGLTYSPANVRNDGVRVLRSSNINGDTFVLKDDDVFVEPKAVNIDFVKENDILITAANGSSRLVGKHALVKNTGRKVVHGGFMLVATAEEPEFINSLMSSQWYEKFINIYVAGGNGAIGNLSKSDLEEQSIIAPIVSEQKRIGKFFGCLDNLITIHQSKIEKLQNIKKACLENMFI